MIPYPWKVPEEVVDNFLLRLRSQANPVPQEEVVDAISEVLLPSVLLEFVEVEIDGLYQRLP